MPAPLLPERPVPRRPLLRLALLGALLSGPVMPTPAQVTPVRPDSVVVPSPPAPAVVADTLRRPAAEPPPDADPTPGPVSRRAGLTILGVCALLTISTLLLYNVRSR